MGQGYGLVPVGLPGVPGRYPARRRLVFEQGIVFVRFLQVVGNGVNRNATCEWYLSFAN